MQLILKNHLIQYKAILTISNLKKLKENLLSKKLKKKLIVVYKSIKIEINIEEIVTRISNKNISILILREKNNLVNDICLFHILLQRINLVLFRINL